MSPELAAKIISADLAHLSAKLERTARDQATERVARAVDPLIAPLVQELRRALHKVVGDHADVIVVELVNGLRGNIIGRVGPVAENLALEDILQRLTAEVEA